MNEIIHTGYDLRRTPDGLNFEVLDEMHDQPTATKENEMNDQATVTSTYTRMTMAEIRALIGDPNVMQEHIATMRGVAYVIRTYAILDDREQWTGFLAVWEGDGPPPTAKTRYPVRRWDCSKNATMTITDLQEAVLLAVVDDVVQSLRANTD